MDRNDSFREFVAGHQQSLMRTAYLLTGDAHQAEDLLQSVLLKVLGRWSRLARVERPEAYARKALLNQYISWRRRRVRIELPTADPPDRPYSSEDSTIVRLVMRRALMRLPPRQRAVIVTALLRGPDRTRDSRAAELLDRDGEEPGPLRAGPFTRTGARTGAEARRPGSRGGLPMTWLRNVLVDLADDSPQVDLAERTIATHDRRRRTVLSHLAAAMIVVIALGVTAAVRLLPDGAQEAASQGDLPGTWGGAAEPRVQDLLQAGQGGRRRQDCRDGGWRVVTRSGKTYNVTEALPSLSPGRSGLRDSPLAISRDGRKIAYYSAKEGTFQVRDLASGQKTTAADKVPKGWLGSISHLMLSDDGRFVAFSKVPDFKDPALLIDMRARVVRELPNRWVPIGLSQDGATITLAEYSPNSQLRTISNLWPSSSAGNSTSIILPKHYHFSPLAPDGKTVAAIETAAPPRSPAVMATSPSWTRSPARSGRRPPSAACPPTSPRYRCAPGSAPTRSPLSPHPCGADRRSEVPDDEPAVVDPPYQAMTAYAVNVRTGKARKLATYKAQSFFDIVLPGPPGAL